MARGEAKKRAAKRDRGDAEAGIAFAVAAGWIVETEHCHATNGTAVKALIPGKETP